MSVVGFIQAFTRLEFQPDEAKTFSVLWDQTNNAGIAVGPGKYDAQGYIATTEESRRRDRETSCRRSFGPRGPRSRLSNGKPAGVIHRRTGLRVAAPVPPSVSLVGRGRAVRRGPAGLGRRRGRGLAGGTVLESVEDRKYA